MARYSVPLLSGVSVTSTFKSIGVLTGGNRRQSIYEFDLGQPGGLNTSTDCQMQYDVSRFTVTNTVSGSVITPATLDPGDGAAAIGSFLNAIVTELTVLAFGSGQGLLQIPMNQRGTFRWRALDDGDNIIIAGTAGFGIATRVLSSAYTGTAMGSIHYQEL